MSESLETGMVGINVGILSASGKWLFDGGIPLIHLNAEGAFGGIKESGYGKEGSKYGLDGK